MANGVGHLKTLHPVPGTSNHFLQTSDVGLLAYRICPIKYLWAIVYSWPKVHTKVQEQFRCDAPLAAEVPAFVFNKEMI